MTVEICLVRHAHAMSSGDHMVNGRWDPPLSSVGAEQALVLARRLAAHRWHHVITSPLLRAFQTAAAIGAECGLTASVDPRWMEHHQGDFERPELQPGRGGADPTLRGRWTAWPNGETRSQFRQRLIAALDDVSSYAAGSRIVVVTHSGAINDVLNIVVGCERPAAFHIDTTGIVRLVASAEGVLVGGVNDVWHLQDPLDNALARAMG